MAATLLRPRRTLDSPPRGRMMQFPNFRPRRTLDSSPRERMMHFAVEPAGGASVSSLRVVLADDHRPYREGLTRRLRQSGIDVVGSAPRADTAIRTVEETAPDVVVMDLKMPDLSGLEATRRLTADERRVLVLTVSADEDDVADAILAGASGYVLKERPMEQLIDDIRAVAAGETLMSSQIATALLRRTRHLTSGAVDVRMSAREVDLLAALAGGMDEKEAATATGLTLSTARDRIRSIVAKLRVADRVYAALKADREASDEGAQRS